MTDSPDALLTVPPPDLSDAACTALARDHFGLTGSITRLTSERDLNLRLTGAQGDFVVKIANAAEPPAQTRFQNRALIHIAQRNPALPVPRVITARDGGSQVALPGGETLRVLSWLDGEPLHRAPRSAAQRRAMGAMLAGLAVALQDFTDPAADHDLLWDIRHAPRLRALLPHVADAGLRDLAARVLDRFDESVAPVLPGLRWQVVHNDLNPHNVLVDVANPDRVAGVLDFGDMVRTPLVCDIGVAGAYQVGTDTPLLALADFTAGYHAVNPLTATELALIFDLVAARMVTTVAITSWRAARYPGNAPYILRNFAAARDGLRAFATLSPETARRTLFRACGME